MSNGISSLGFCFRSGEKTEEGHWGRAPVMLGQARNGIIGIRDSIMALDNSLSKSAKSATEAFERLAESNKFVYAADKTIGFLSRNVNPLIIASSGIDVALSKDKKTAIAENGMGLLSMFGIEKVMKTYMGKKTEEKLAKEFIERFKWHNSKGRAAFAAQAIYGALFCASSVAFWTAGCKFGDLLLGKNY